MNLGKENETAEFKETTSELRQAIMNMSAAIIRNIIGLKRKNQSSIVMET